MKIYTRTGDDSSTGLFGGPRVRKDHARIEAYGTVDELNAYLGVVRCSECPESIDQTIELIQNELFSVGAELASPDAEKHGLRIIGKAQIETMELTIDQFEADLHPLKMFILPTGSVAATNLHVARAVCRRAERRVITLANCPEVDISSDLIVYLNRLSDLLFVLARAANHDHGVKDQPWRQSQKPT